VADPAIPMEICSVADDISGVGPTVGTLVGKTVRLYLTCQDPIVTESTSTNQNKDLDSVEDSQRKRYITWHHHLPLRWDISGSYGWLCSWR